MVDDASMDRTRIEVERVARSHRNIVLIQSDTNRGVAASRNCILDRARGDFIAFFDDDDVSRAERLEMQWNRIVDYEHDFANGAPVICHSAREQIYPNGRRRIETTMGTNRGCRAPSGLAVAYRVLTGAPLDDGYGSCATSSQMARAATYRALGGFDPVFRRSEDTEFCIRFARAGGHFVGLEQPLVIQTMTKTSDKNLDQEREFVLMVTDKHRDIFDNQDVYDFCREWISLKYSWLGSRRLDTLRRLAKIGATHPLLAMRRAIASLRNFGGNRAARHFYR